MTAAAHTAVFLSYASEDAEAARRIAEALRTEGLEVWLDQSELRGGDAWDHFIRGKIRDCALFVPIISASTQARGEGYFRLEWRLAVERSQLMADDQAFLVPVAIDDTPESSARVPDVFHARQWIRLRDAEPTTEFSAQLKRLLARSAATGEPVRTTAPAAARRHSTKPVIAAVSVAGLVAVGGYYATRTQPPASLAPAPMVKASAVITAASPNSIAVLPFANLSDDKQNEYFSDGISEELLTTLQKISALQVVARSSSFSFKGTNATAQEMGRKLGASHLVEGSVRKAGQTVRITARLSNASTGEQLWSDAYTRDLNDVFSVQSELARTIVEQLRPRLSQSASLPSQAQVEAQVAAAAKGGTRNAQAHQLYLQGLYYVRQNTLPAARTATEFLERAVTLDPQFALAWAGLSEASNARGGFSDTRAEYDAGLARSRQAALHALAIEPSLPSAHLALATVQVWQDFDWSGAAKSIANARAIAPNDDEALYRAGNLALFLGRNEAALRFAQQAVARDPLNVQRRQLVVGSLIWMGRLDDAAAQLKGLVDFRPGAPYSHFNIARVRLLQKRFDEALKEVSSESEELGRLQIHAMALWPLEKRRESDAALERLIAAVPYTHAYQIAEIYAHRGDRERAFEWLERSYRQRDGGLAYLKSSPFFASLVPDRRWDGFLRKLGLADDQVKSIRL